MDDMIYRQSAIDALDGEISVTGRANAEAVIGYVKLVADRFKRLPSVQPERKKGKWTEWWPGDCALIMTGEEMLWQCSECESKYIQKSNFCPNCGAEMEEENG